MTKLRQNIFLGKELLLENELRDTVNKSQGVSLDYYIVMPNHVHIIFILKDCSTHLGEIVRKFKAKVSRGLGESVWQWNYYEHIIRNEQALNKIREYIVNNPQELLLEFDQFYK